MAPLKFKKVLGFSSEDPQFPASNLVEKSKWRCREEGEKQAWVSLQLEELSQITNIDIGNFGAAFIEVQVGRQGCNLDQMKVVKSNYLSQEIMNTSKMFKVLLVASSFMSVNEARVGDQSGRVRMFGNDKLASDVSKEKWDVVKVIATQPFNKHTKYGISFISVTGPNVVVEQEYKPVSKLGAFQLKTDEDDDISIGSYFNKKKDKDSSVKEESNVKQTVAASLRSEKTLAEMALSSNKKEDKKRKLELTSAMKDEVKRRKVERNFPSRLNLPGEDQEKKTTPSKQPKVKENKATPSRPQKVKEEKATPVKKESPSPKARTSKESKECKENLKQLKSKPKLYSKFNEMMKGVHFAISGFQNPLRGEIRQKAVDMGARYHGDWNSSCTHLVCAFTNTPKFNQVKGKGRIVKKDWIEECHSERTRFPWRRFALDKADLKEEESEDEVHEEQSSNNNDYDCDTDEEIDRIKQEEMNLDANAAGTSNSYDCDTDEEEEKPKEDVRSSPKKKPHNPWEDDTDEEDIKDRNDEELYAADTDIDEDMKPKTSHLTFEKLPNFFEGLTFFVGKDIESGELKLVKRYIVSAGGSLQIGLDSKVTHLVTRNSSDKIKVKSSVILIEPAWIFNCYDEGSLTNVDKYLVD